jgi:tetratricopeptide (TPR) repeat protein
MSALSRAWSWLSNPRRQKTLSFLGAGLVVVASGGWQVYQHFTATEANGHPQDIAQIIAAADELARKAEQQAQNHELGASEVLLRRSVDVLKKGLGPQDGAVAEALRRLAWFYATYDPGRDRLEPVLREMLAIDEKALGPDHPNVADDLAWLAGFYKDHKRAAEAVPLYQRALSIHRANGKRAAANRVRLDLADAYYRGGERSEAEALIEGALADDPGLEPVARKIRDAEKR